MADMMAVFGLLLIMGVAFPALLLVVWLTFPATVDRAQQRVATMPGRCFWLGLLILLLLTVPLVALFNRPGPGQFAASLLLLLTLTVSTVGAAGIAARLGARLQSRNQDAPTAHTAFLYGATVLELAVGFPVIGWVLLLPLVIILALGATTYALLRRHPRTRAQTPALAPSAVAQV